MCGYEYVELSPEKWEDVARAKVFFHVYVASGQAGHYIRISKGPWPGWETV
jgi:predicted membrane channel-forming protein YqfA (hemolysin III family)